MKKTQKFALMVAPLRCSKALCTVILQIFGEVIFSVVNGFTEIKKTPKI